MKKVKRFWYDWGANIVAAIVVIFFFAAILWYSVEAYEQCLEDGYNRTQCRMMVFNNNRSAVVVEGNQ